MPPDTASQPTLLVIEDDAVLGAHLVEHLTAHGFQVSWQRDGRLGLEHAQRTSFDLVLLDILLPGMNGLEVLRQLRSAQAVPVILLSALGAEADRIEGFRHGADDYLPKPFSTAELRVRIEAVLRRVALERGFQKGRNQSDLVSSPAPVASSEPAIVSQTTSDEPLHFNELRQDVEYRQRWAGLTHSEFRLLDTLWRNADEVLSKAFLYQHVLHRGYAQHDRSLDMHISQIRRKLKAVHYRDRHVHTVWGKGYALTAEQGSAD